MKNFLIGIIYTVVVAGCLAHFAGCDVPDISAVTDLLLTPGVTAEVTPTPEPVRTPEVEPTVTPVTEVTEEPTPSPEVTDVPDVYGITATDDYVWTTGSLNVRKGPGSEHDKLGVITGNTKVHRTGICENGWLRIEYKNEVAYISGKYCTTTEPVVTKAPATTLTPTPRSEATLTPTAASTPTSVPVTGDSNAQTPGSSTAVVNDDTDKLLASINSVGNGVDIGSASNFYYDNEKDATTAFFRYASGYTTFSILYKNKECMHTPEYYHALYPEIYKIEIDYSRSKRFSNGIYMVYKTELVTGGQYIYAIRTGDTSYLKDTELAALKRIIKLSKEMGLDEKSELDIALTVHDYLINNTRYDSTIADISHTPYGLLANKTAVCDGYAKSFMIFMLVNNVECNTIAGYANEDHAWNQVRIDGEWYNVDVTWDDPVTRDTGTGELIDTLSYTYFLVNDDIMIESHTPESGYVKKCTSDRYHMLMYEPYFCDTPEEVKGQIERQIGEESIFLVYDENRFTREELNKLFLELHNVTFYSRKPVEVRKGRLMYEIINPLK